MNGSELGEAVKARLESLTPRTVYLGTPPDGTLPTRYLVVIASSGWEFPTRAVDVANMARPEVWVRSISRNHDADLAEHEARWGAERARDALRGWRPESLWRIRHVASVPAARDEAIAETTFYATEQYRVHTYTDLGA